MADKIMLIDGHSILSRAFFGLPLLSNARGEHTNAVLGFLNIMLRYIEEEEPTHLLVAFDRKEPTFRHLAYKDYKGNRSPMPKELHEQVPTVKRVLSSMEIPIVTQAGIEADDILGTIGREAEEEGFEVVTVSGDRDLLQLATGKVKIKIPKTKGGKTITEDYYAPEVEALYGVSPKEFIEMKGLMGDSSDNIPGVPGIGEKTAGNIIKTWHSIENAYDHIDEIKPPRARNNLREYYDQAIMSRDLATIKTDCQLEYEFHDARIKDLFTKEAYREFKELELKSLFHYFEDKRKEDDSVEVTLVEDREKALEIFAQVRQAGYAGLGMAASGAVSKALALSYSDNAYLNTALEDRKDAKRKTALLITGSGLTDKEIKNGLMGLLKDGITFAVPDYKDLLRYLEAARDYEERIEDVGLIAYLLNPLATSYACEDLAGEYLSKVLPSEKEVFGKKPLYDAFDRDSDQARAFLANRAAAAYEVCPLLCDKLKEEGMEDLYVNIERPVVPTLYDMETFGIRVEREALEAYASQLEVRIKELEKAIYDQAGKEFNINSPKQLGVILFEEMKLPYAKKTKTGYSTSADILEKLAPDYPMVSDILSYRQVAKLKSTYADGLASFIREDGRIHGIFHQKVTATGRLSSSDPNLQNIPIRLPLGREIRKVFVPDPGYVFVSADYSQIELRVLAHMAGDENLIEAYKQDRDIHASTASQVFHVPLSEVTPQLRRSAKAVNFGIVYGISAFGLGQDLDITRKEAEEYIKRYFAAYPGIKAYLDGNVAYAKKHGYVRTLYGRVRPIPELFSSNFMQRSFGERAAMNSPIQGTAADIIKIAMVRVSRRLKEEKLTSRLILQIHDELLIEAKEEEIGKIRQVLTEEMMGAADLRVPLSIDIEEGMNWYEAK